MPSKLGGKELDDYLLIHFANLDHQRRTRCCLLALIGWRPFSALLQRNYQMLDRSGKSMMNGTFKK